MPKLTVVVARTGHEKDAADQLAKNLTLPEKSAVNETQALVVGEELIRAELDSSCTLSDEDGDLSAFEIVVWHDDGSQLVVGWEVEGWYSEEV